MKLLDDYFRIQKEIHDYFGYQEDWVAIPLEDKRDYFWKLTGEGYGDSVRYACTEVELHDEEAGDFFEDEIYTQRFLPKWVYRGKDYTMVCADTHCDGNRFLMVFENSKELE